MKLAMIVAVFMTLSGCTIMIGHNEEVSIQPRGSYRSVDTSGEGGEGLQEMQGGADVDTKVTPK
jgi:hypothetical protein